MSTAPAPRPRHPARVTALGAGAALLALGIFLALNVEAGPAEPGSRLQGRPVPPFDLPTLDGGRVRSADLRGKTVFVNFWNTWCIPCREEEPELERLYERHRDERDFVMIGILRDDTVAAARRHVAREGTPWTVALDPGGRAALDFGTTGQPETYVVGPDGVVSGVLLGPGTVETFETMIDLARTGRAP